MNDVNSDTVAAFDRDVTLRGGYQYTTNAPLSSQMANRRLTDAALEACALAGKRIIDIGCGDGTYTTELYDTASPASIVGLDPAAQAISAAREKVRDRRIHFEVGSAYDLPAEPGEFDVAHLRGVLHHLARPEEAIQEALRAARHVIIIEPNGYSPVLKLLERFSKYHREHEERSYRASTLARWVVRAGGRIEKRSWVGLVPFFCPDSMARVLKYVEPVFEGVPGLNALSCAVAVITASRPATVAHESAARSRSAGR